MWLVRKEWKAEEQTCRGTSSCRERMPSFIARILEQPADDLVEEKLTAKESETKRRKERQIHDQVHKTVWKAREECIEKCDQQKIQTVERGQWKEREETSHLKVRKSIAGFLSKFKGERQEPGCGGLGRAMEEISRHADGSGYQHLTVKRKIEYISVHTVNYFWENQTVACIQSRRHTWLGNGNEKRLSAPLSVADVLSWCLHVVLGTWHG